MKTLYRKGTGKRVNGLMCDRIDVVEDGIDRLLDMGWFKTPADAHANPRLEAIRIDKPKPKRKRRAKSAKNAAKKTEPDAARSTAIAPDYAHEANTDDHL